LRVELRPGFVRQVRRLSREQQEAVQASLDAVMDGFGRPHLHAGLGVRKLHKRWFECRAGLETRLVFLAQKGVLTFHLAGNHDDVRRFLKSL